MINVSNAQDKLAFELQNSLSYLRGTKSTTSEEASAKPLGHHENKARKKGKK